MTSSIPSTLRTPLPLPPSTPPARRVDRLRVSSPRGPTGLEILLTHTRARPLPLAHAARLLGLDLDAARGFVTNAQARGYELALEGDQVVRRPALERDEVQELPAPASRGRRFVVGVLSDTHLGSTYCLRRALQEFVTYAYRKGARHILHAGDVLDGCYRHGVFELSHSGLEAQTRDLFETLPRLEGLTYHAIGGNHDDTFSDSAGLDAGHYVEQLFHAKGREDFVHHGRRSAYLRVGGAVVHLWHPRGSCGASVEPRVRQKILSYAPGQVPNVLLVGHWHRFVHTSVRGVEGLACPTFQGGGSAFGKSLVGEPSIGGLVLSWTRLEQGRLRSFRVERCSYPERETLHDLGGFVFSPSPAARVRQVEPPDTLPMRSATKAVAR